MPLLLNNNVINKVFYNNNVGYTIVGSPTISDGIASNFSSGNYIKLQSNIPIITSFEENIRFKITQDCAGKSLLSYSTTYNSNNLEGNINISNNLDSINVFLFIKYDGTYEEYSIQYNFSQHLNKYFTFKVYTDLSNVYLYLYDENNTLVETNTYTNINLAGIIDGNKILIGNIFDESDYWPSEIDLNNTYIKFNGVTWFNGKEQTSIDVDYLALNNDIIWIKNPFNKPSDWFDIRTDCPDNSIALYACHSADYSAYDNLGFTATCTGGYNVFIDGTQYGTTYASGAQCNITWSISGITTGDDITTPSALKAHKIWIEPATEGNNITAFKFAQVDTSDDNETQGALWVHFNITNAINLENMGSPYPYTYGNYLLTAVTAKNNVIDCGNNYVYATFNISALTYVPMIKNGSISSIAFSGSGIQKVTLDNCSFGDNSNYCFNACHNLNNVKLKNPTFIQNGKFVYTFYQTMLKTFPANWDWTNIVEAQDIWTDYDRVNNNGTPTVIDTRTGTGLKILGIHDTNTLVGLRVSNQAPFDNATSPQINVSYTGMDKSALVQLFNDLPYNVGYTTEGNPTITDGVITPTSSSDVVKTSQSFSFGNSGKYEFNVRFKVSNSGSLHSILGTDNIWERPFFLVDGNNILFQVPSGSNMYPGFGNISTDTWYRSKVIGDNGIWTIWLYDDSGTLINSGTYNDSASSDVVTCTSLLFANYYGTGNAGVYLDLNNTSIKVNDVPWFRGQPAMTKTINVVGCTGTSSLTADDRAIVTNKGWSITYQ